MSPRRALGSREGLAPPEDSIFSQWVNEWTSYPPRRNPCTNTNALHPVTELIWLQSLKGRWSWTHLRIWWKLPAPNVNRILHSTSEISWTTEFNVKNFWSLIQSSSFTNVPREQKWLAQDHIAGKKKRRRRRRREGNLFWAVNDQDFLIFPDPSFTLGRDSQHIHLELDFSTSKSFV